MRTSLKIAGILAGTGVVFLTACGGTTQTHAHTPPLQTQYVNACRVDLAAWYQQLGAARFGTGRFQAAVNAEAFGGGLPKPCMAISNVRQLAREVSR